MIEHIHWQGDASTGSLHLLDQTLLPQHEEYLDCRDVQAVWDAIQRLSVRGAPAIGIAAAYGCVIGVQGQGDTAAALRDTATHLASSRPTAVNLFWALERMKRVTPCTPDALLAEARAIHAQDAAMCRAIGEHGLELLRRHVVERGKAVLTHCNAGALATGGIGTATAPMYLAHQRGLRFSVLADETRPLLQGARLTAYELQKAGLDVTLICDDMAGQVMREGRVGMVITGADRIAGNGDAANKIGTYSVAVLAKHHGIPFYVAAPSSTFDLAIASGSQIPIEQRSAQEITEGFGRRTAPEGVKTYSPAFDVTPAELITAIVTEKGLITPVNEANVRRMVGAAR
jgi:methylthioribose-1-phosphate isomerase